MRIYEELFIIRPDAPEEEIDAYIEQIKELIVKSGGTVEKADKWGVRKLAYRVDKRTEGFYVLVQFTAEAAAVKEVERRMRVTDMVIKWITVRIDEKLKKLEKRTKQREKRAKRRPAPSERSPVRSLTGKRSSSALAAASREPAKRTSVPPLSTQSDSFWRTCSGTMPTSDMTIIAGFWSRSWGMASARSGLGGSTRSAKGERARRM